MDNGIKIKVNFLLEGFIKVNLGCSCDFPIVWYHMNINLLINLNKNI